jgi:hypothetical protein
VLNRASSDCELVCLQVDVAEGLFCLDGSERFGEKVGNIVIHQDVSQVKVVGFLNVVLKPMVPDIDVPGAMLVDDVFEKGESSLVVTMKCDVGVG